jgi:type IV secretion system protein VirB10
VADNLSQNEKSTKQFQNRKIMLFMMTLAFFAVIPVIVQRFYAESRKNKEETDARSIVVPRQPADTGIGLSELVMSLQQGRDSQRAQTIEVVAVPVSDDGKPPEREQAVSVPARPPRRAVQPVKRLKVPDEELVKLGAQLRNSKIHALQSSPQVGGFAAAGDTGAKAQQAPQTPRADSTLAAGPSGLGLGELGLGGRYGAGPAPEDPNKQQEKIEFLYSKAAGFTPQGYSAHIPIPRQFPYELKAGTLIPGIMISGMNSDLPGVVMGQVSEHVYDTATGGAILIPKGSRVIGVYDSNVSYGQKRVIVVWNRVIAPDGTSLNISGSQGLDRAGYSGMSGRVDEHWGRLIGTALLASAFAAGADAVAPDTVYDGNGNGNRRRSPSEILSEAAANTAIEVGAKLTEKASNIQPTIKIRPGTRFNVFVAQDVVFPTAWETRGNP